MDSDISVQFHKVPRLFEAEQFCEMSIKACGPTTLINYSICDLYHCQEVCMSGILKIEATALSEKQTERLMLSRTVSKTLRGRRELSAEGETNMKTQDDRQR